FVQAGFYEVALPTRAPGPDPRDLTEPSRFPNHFFCDSWVVGFLEGPTMVRRTSHWRDELGRWLKPFLDRLGHKARRQMCPLYVSGLIWSWRSQEHSADGEAACAGRMRPIAPLHCCRGLGCNASGNRTAYPSR